MINQNVYPAYLASEGIEVIIVGYIKKCSEQVVSPSDDGFNGVIMIHT